MDWTVLFRFRRAPHASATQLGAWVNVAYWLLLTITKHKTLNIINFIILFLYAIMLITQFLAILSQFTMSPHCSWHKLTFLCWRAVKHKSINQSINELIWQKHLSLVPTLKSKNFPTLEVIDFTRLLAVWILRRSTALEWLVHQLYWCRSENSFVNLFVCTKSVFRTRP